MTSPLVSTIGNVDLDIDLAARVCWGILKGSKHKPAQFRPLFGAFPEVSIEDVHQEMMLAICRQWCGYDPAKSAPQTVFHQWGHSAMLDLHRRCVSGKAKVRRLMQMTEEKDLEYHDAPTLRIVEQDTVPAAEILAANHEIAKKLFGGRKHRRGRKRYTKPQLMALGMFMRRFGMGGIRARAMLLSRPELGEAVRLRSIPSFRCLDYATATLRRFETEHAPMPENPAKVEPCLQALEKDFLIAA